ncbi:MAG: hypothetical protein MMC33_010673 [Icmadophila ericetorum]|nr:hypothetical protein [Icmadophila ericetorum]
MPSTSRDLTGTGQISFATAAAQDYGEKSFAQGQRHNRISGAISDKPTAVMAEVEEQRPDIDISAGQKMLSAVSGSLLTSLLVTPLDVVRVRLQSQPTPSSSVARNISSLPLSPPSSLSPLTKELGVTACCREVFWVGNNAQFCIAGQAPPFGSLNTFSSPAHTTSISAAECAVDETRRKAFTSTFDGLRKIARYEGLPSLWRGLSPTLVMAIPANVIYFTGYDWLRSSPRSPLNNHVSDTYVPLIAGSIARVAAASVISPIEMFRTRMQATSHRGSGVFRQTLVGLQDMVKSQGYTSLWRGLTLTMWRDVPFSGIYWWGYEATRNSLTDVRDRQRGRTLDPQRSHTRQRSRSRSNENHTATFVDSFIAGATSGAVAAIVTTPFDVGKTRQQVLKHSSPSASSSTSTSSIIKSAALSAIPPEERSMPRFLYHIFRTEGLPGLFKGWAARTLKVAPACAIMISSYEVGKNMARSVNERSTREGGKAV